MEDDVAAALFRLTNRVDELELRCKILGYAFRGAIEYMNPTSQTAARRMANTAVLANCPPDQRVRRLQILAEVFPEARDGGAAKGEFIPPSS